MVFVAAASFSNRKIQMYASFVEEDHPNFTRKRLLLREKKTYFGFFTTSNGAYVWTRKEQYRKAFDLSE